MAEITGEWFVWVTSMALFSFLTEKAPSMYFPQSGMRPTDGMRLDAEDSNLEGDRGRHSSWVGS